MAYRHKFVDGVHKPPAEWSRSGKPEWPNMLDLHLGRAQALDLIGRIVTQLRDPACEAVELNLVGRLSENEDE